MFPIPYSSGHFGHQEVIHYLWVHLGPFQSPIHRGTSVIRRQPHRLRGNEQVSIPYSSGHFGHHLLSVWTIGQMTKSFNPLFIGALRSSVSARQRLHFFTGSFNPLFIGVLRSSMKQPPTHLAKPFGFQSYSPGHSLVIPAKSVILT